MPEEKQPLTILLADDHPMFRQGLAELLRNQGADWRIVGQAANGEDAVRLAEALQPDLVVLDVEMPRMNGIEAATQIRLRSPASLIIALSMHDDEYHRRRMTEAGANAYVVKSESVSDLVAAIQTLRRGDALHASDPDGIPPNPATSPLSDEDKLRRLTKREREVLRMVAQGQRSKEIALTLGISIKTVETYRFRLGAKLGIDSIQGLVLFALRTGLITAKTDM